MTTDPKNQAASKAADTNRSIHLSASAGSGKTRALKERYLALLDKLDLRGLNIDQAVAITFTDKAAAEIKERVMHDLPDAMLKKIIRGRQDLRISTIHSFCMNLLKRYPLEAGLPPDFSVLDSRDQVYKIRRSIEDSLEEADRDPVVMAPLSAFTADELVESVEFLLKIRTRLKRVEIDAKGPEGMLRSVQAGMDMETIEAELGSLVGSPAWRALFLQMELLLRSQGDLYETCRGAAHHALASAPDQHAAYRITGSLMPIYFTLDGGPRKRLPIAKGKYRKNEMFSYAVYETLCSQVIDTLSRFNSAYRRAQAGREAISLLQLYLLAEERYQQAKLREGLLDFDDLEICAYRLLQGMESPEILYWLDRKILHFLVDEFQDTSDIQWAILNKLTEEIFAGQGTEKRMAPTLFVVGDEKQSIYRFREANYRLIRDIQGKMETLLLPEAREILTLQKNYRSTPAVIETVNRIFSVLWGEAYQPSEPDRSEHAGSVRLIEVLPKLRDDDRMGQAPAEAAILAQEIRQVVDSNTMIYERSGDGWNKRAADFGDCAILIQSRTRLKEYEAALQEAGVPFRVVGGIGFYEEDEIQSILNVLFFLWNRDDKLSLAAALRSALFGMTDREILDLMLDNRNMLEGLKERRPDAWMLIHGWERNAGLAPLSVLVHRIIADTGAYVRFGRRNAQAIFNLDKLLDTARDFDRRGYTTLQDFVEWIRNIREAEQREATADMNLPGFKGAVSVMTVHKAKGLEFPILFLPGMNQQPRSVTTGPLAIVENSGSGLRLAVKDGDNPLYHELWEREKQELQREHQRLLYVAMTRARDCLVMIGTLDKNNKPFKESAWLNYLHQAIPVSMDGRGKNGTGITVSSYPEWQAEMLPVLQAGFFQKKQKEETPGTMVNAQTILDTIAPVPSSASLEWRTATDLISRDREDAVEQLSLEKSGHTISPLTRGSILHRCLEEYTKTGACDLDRIIDEYPEMHAVSPEVRAAVAVDADAVLKKVLGTPAFAWIFKQLASSYSELPFICRRGQTLISGIMDRVVIQGDTGYVIDYKAIAVQDEAETVAWKDHYRPQVQVYCEAIKELFRLHKVEGLLLFLDSARLELTVTV
jgi:ATP-dependent helicase/nuclease subunit A